MTPPKELQNFGEFKDLTVEQAKLHFEWYIGEIPKRMKLLQQYVNIFNNDLELDYSPESLLEVWKIFIDKIELRNKTDKEVESELSKHPKHLHKELLKNNKTFTTETLIVAMDIAIYFAEVIVRNNENINWGYFTEPLDMMDVNEPVLLGFKFDKIMNPRVIIYNSLPCDDAIYNFVRLSELYTVWQKFI